MRLPVDPMDRRLRTPRRRSRHSTILVERLGARIGNRDLDLLPFDGVANARVQVFCVDLAVIVTILIATAATVYS